MDVLAMLLLTFFAFPGFAAWWLARVLYWLPVMRDGFEAEMRAKAKRRAAKQAKKAERRRDHAEWSTRK